MAQYMCGPCGWIYDEELGDPEHGIAPGQSLKTSPTTGNAPNAAWAKKISTCWIS
ncbi:TPA: rubredoxin [Neisseria gonorrhoeae]